MVESTRQVQPRDPFERFDEPIDSPGLYEATYQTYEFPQATAVGADPPAPDHLENDPAPLFLADPRDARYQQDDRY
jgi:hypothetical protein